MSLESPGAIPGEEQHLENDPIRDLRATRWVRPLAIWFGVSLLISPLFDPWLTFYYGTWVVIGGWAVVHFRIRIAAFADELPGPRPVVFVGVGLIAVLVGETLAAIAQWQGTGLALGPTIVELWSVNLAVLGPALVAWAILLGRYSFRARDVLGSWGIIGVIVEGGLVFLVTSPLVFVWAFPLLFVAPALVFLVPYLVMRREAAEGPTHRRWWAWIVAMGTSILVTMALLSLYVSLGGPIAT
jgi:hypothetical protein